MSDFDTFSKGYAEVKAKVMADVPGAPPWLQAHPMHFYFGENLKFDYEALAFLFQEGGAANFGYLHLAEQRYHDLASIVKIHSEAVADVQKRLAEAGLTSKSEFLITDAAKAAGPELVAKVSSLFESLEHRFKSDRRDYERAFSEMQKTMRQIFGKKGVLSFESKSEGGGAGHHSA
jgi:hypothetical protein